MNILVTGANGMLGSSVMTELPSMPFAPVTSMFMISPPQRLLHHSSMPSARSAGQF